MAKRKKKPTTAKKHAKKRKKTKASAPPRKRASAERQSDKRKDGAKRGGTAEPDRAVSRAGSATLLPPKPPRPTARSRNIGAAASDKVTQSDRDIAAIDAARAVSNADRIAGGSCPMQTGEHAPPTRLDRIAEGVAEQEDRLEEVTPRLADANEDELLRTALWWAGRARLPRAAIVGRALHEKQSFTEELASKRGTAAEICQKIRDRNPAHLRDAIRRMIESAKSTEDIDAALVGHLNGAWAVLERLNLLKAAPRAGVYLIGRGQKVFKGFPDWNKADEPWPEKPTRLPKKPRS